MSLYGPRFSLPSMPRIPKPDMEGLKKPLLAAIAVIIVVLLGVLIVPYLSGASTGLFSAHTSVSWKNNPLDLTKENVYESKLVLTLTNTTKETKTITLNVSTDSEELIIFCPHKTFPNVSPGNSRKTSCIVRRNPKDPIFSGSYTIHVSTNLGETNTVLDVVAG